MEDRKHYWEDICIPRNEFIKEHVHLLKLLKHGNRAQLLEEAKSQGAELKGKTGGSRAAGYIKKLIAMYKDGQEGFDIQKMKWASDNLKAFGISMEEDEGPVGADDYSEYSPKEAEVHRKLNALAKKADREGNTAEIKAEYKQLRAELKAEPKSFGSTVSEQVENILKTLYGEVPIDRQKQAVRKALEILRYKENRIIQEARKPLQRKLIVALNQIKNNPKRKKYDLFGQSPATGKPMSRNIDNTELAKEIPSFEKSVVDIVEAEVKAEQKAQKSFLKKQQEEFRKQEEEREKKDKEYASKVDIQALREQYGTGKDKKYPSDKLFKKLVDNGITDVFSYERNRGSLPHYKDFVAAFGNTFFLKLDEYIEDRR